MVTSAKMVLCDACNVWVKAQGVGTHRRQKHQVLQNKTPLCAGENSTFLLGEIKQQIDDLKRLYNNSDRSSEILDKLTENYSDSPRSADENLLSEKIEKLNLQMDKLLSRIQNIENILRF